MPKSKNRKTSAAKVAQKKKQQKEQQFAAKRKQAETLALLTEKYRKQYREAVQEELTDRESRAGSTVDALSAIAGNSMNIINQDNPFAEPERGIEITKAAPKSKAAPKTTTKKTAVVGDKKTTIAKSPAKTTTSKTTTKRTAATKK